MTMTKMLINFYYIFFCRVQRYQENKQMVKAGLKEPRGNASKTPVDFVGEFVPPENDNLAVERHLKALVREERNKKRRPGVISTLMRVSSYTREAEIRSLEASSRVKETFDKYTSLLNPTEVSSKKYSVIFTNNLSTHNKHKTQC